MGVEFLLRSLCVVIGRNRGGFYRAMIYVFMSFLLTNRLLCEMMVRCWTFLKFKLDLYAILGPIYRWFANLSTFKILCPANGNIFLKSHQSNKRSEVQILQRKVTASIQHPLEGVCQVRNWSICLWPPLYSSVCFIHRCYVKRSIKWGFSDQKTQIIFRYCI